MKLVSEKIAGRSTVLLFFSAASSAILLGMPWAAHAQTAPAGATASPAAGQQVQEVVVTAQRRAERIQDVPISMDALGSQAIANQQIADVSDLRGKVAGLTITTWAASNASNQVSIRGISGLPLSIGASQATAIYLDGVYLSRPDAAFFGLDDVERIEVLRGPQGTLYGRNATAGAINIITRDPTKTLTGGLTASYGTYGTYDVLGSVSGPLFGNFTFGLSGNAGGHGDYYTNTRTNTKVGNLWDDTGRVKLRYDNNAGTFDATLAVDAAESSGPAYYKPIVNAAGIYVGIGNPTQVYATLPDNQFEHDIRSSGASLVSNYKFGGDFVATSITSYRHETTGLVWDSSPLLPTGQLAVIYDTSDAFSQELRGVYNGPKLKVTFGGNYYNERGTLAYFAAAPPRLNGAEAPYDSSFDEALAAFVQGEYKFTDELTATAGLRYNYEHRNFIVDYRYDFPTPAGVGIAREYDSVALPAFGLNYKPTFDTLVYAKVSEGYQAPGVNFLPGLPSPQVNPTTGQPNPPVMNPFPSEKMWAYEAGLKSQWFERLLTVNLDAFYYDYLNISARNTVAAGIATVSGAGPATVKGFDAELTWKIMDGLSVDGHTTYAKSAYTNFCQPISGGTQQGSDPSCTAVINGVSLPGANRSGNALINSPAWSGGSSLNYTSPINNMRLNASVTYSFETRVYFNAVNDPVVSDGNGWQRVDARVGLVLPNRIELFLWGRNLTNDRYLGDIIRVSATSINGTLNDPETYGFGVRYHF